MIIFEFLSTVKMKFEHRKTLSDIKRIVTTVKIESDAFEARQIDDILWCRNFFDVGY